MARFTGKLITTRPAQEVFAYLADFSNAAEWDPQTVWALRLDDGPIRPGSTFALCVRLLGRESEIVYRVSGIDPPRTLELRGENDGAVSVDRITLHSTAHDTTVTYQAEVRLKGALAVLDPLLAVAFRRAGRAALASLRGLLAERMLAAR